MIKRNPSDSVFWLKSDEDNLRWHYQDAGRELGERGIQWSDSHGGQWEGYSSRQLAAAERDSLIIAVLRGVHAGHVCVLHCCYQWRHIPLQYTAAWSAVEAPVVYTVERQWQLPDVPAATRAYWLSAPVPADLLDKTPERAEFGATMRAAPGVRARLEAYWRSTTRTRSHAAWVAAAHVEMAHAAYAASLRQMRAELGAAVSPAAVRTREDVEAVAGARTKRTVIDRVCLWLRDNGYMEEA